MFSASRIASGVAVKLVANGKLPADPTPIAEDAFRRGFELGLSVRSARRVCSTRRLEKEARDGPS